MWGRIIVRIARIDHRVVSIVRMTRIARIIVSQGLASGDNCAARQSANDIGGAGKARQHC